MSKKNKNIQGVVYSTNPEFEYQHQQEEVFDTLPNEKQDFCTKSRAGACGTHVVAFLHHSHELAGTNDSVQRKKYQKQRIRQHRSVHLPRAHGGRHFALPGGPYPGR